MSDSVGTRIARTGEAVPSVAQGNPLVRGPWVGELRDAVACYYGIRYARLSDAKRPRSKATAASGQLDVAGLTDVPVFRQLPSRLEIVTGPAGRINPQDDEAFYLNVWAPEGAEGLPVLVFVHGGAWASGGGAMRWYRGERLAREGIVVVTVNYRLGPAGHLAPDDDADQDHRPFGDLLQALRWVGQNVAELGGDPDRVTLGGQSAGAWYAWALASLPEARGLFRQAAILSIPQIKPWTPDHRVAFTNRVEAIRRESGAAPGSESLLRAAAQVLSETPRIAGAMPPMYLPMLSGEAAGILESATSAAEHLHADALYVRITRHEMSVFLPPLEPGSAAGDMLMEALRARCRREAVPHHPAPRHWDSRYAEAVELSSWLEFGRFANEIATQARKRGRPVISREFDVEAGQPGFGAVHCIDLPFQFGNRADWDDAPMLAGWQGGAFEEISRELRGDLADFVRGRHDSSHRVFSAARHVTHPTDGNDETCAR